MRFRSGDVSVLTAAAAVLVLSQSAAAGQVAYEGFVPSFPVYANGGAGFASPWAPGGFNAFAAGYVPLEGSLCFSNLQTSGGSVSGAAFSAINGTLRNLAQPLGAAPTTVYLSFLVQPQGALDAGLFQGFFGLTLNGSAGNDLFIGKPGGGATDEYVLEARGGAHQVTSGAAVVVGRTALLVVRAELRAGNDLFTLYVNPKLKDPEPSSGVVEADVDLGTVSKIGIYSTGAFAVDEIRMGTTYASVLPTSRNTGHGESHACGGDGDDAHGRER